MFKRYPHLEKFGNQAVENIEFGSCYIFPKLDGTNASVWFKHEHVGEHGTSVILGAGSRNRELSVENDNAGFCQWVDDQCSYDREDDKALAVFLDNYRELTLYGEWLVPHTVKNYRDDAWRKFYVFDVFDNATGKFLPYDAYQPLMEQYGLDYIPCVKIFKNPSWENLMHEAKACKYLLANANEPDSFGEGIVIKNYEWAARNGNLTWAKLVLAEFKDEHVKAMGPNVGENKSTAQFICERACTEALVEKEYAKIVVELDGWSSKYIPRLLHTVFHSVVTEELWDSMKELKFNGLVNFKELQQLCILKVKATKPELF